MDVIRVNKTRIFKCGYELRYELVEDPGNDEPLNMVNAYNPNGDYIGNSKVAYNLVYKRGIQPIISKPNHTVCSIGYSIKDGKWYGWSHRAIYGFKIGSTCKIGDCHYMPSNASHLRADCVRFWHNEQQEWTRSRWETREGIKGIYVYWKYGHDTKNKECRGQIHGAFCPYPEQWGRGEWVAKTTADAKQMAIDFADGIS